MALEFLAGPYPIRHEGKERTSYLQYMPQWLEGIGLAVLKVVYIGQDGLQKDGYSCIIQLDGRACIRNDNPSVVLGTNFHLDLRGAEIILQDPWSRSFRRLSRITLSHLNTVASQVTMMDDTVYAFLPDRVLYTHIQGTGQGTAGFIRSRALENIGMLKSLDPSVVTEIALPHFQASSFRNFTRGLGRTVYLVFSNGVIYHYDYHYRRLLGHHTGLGMSCQSCHFIPELGIFVSVHRTTSPTQDWLRLWANEVKPVNLSSPVALSGLSRGRVSQVAVTLTGSYGEPVSDFLVDWTLTGVGSLTATQSRTDASGQAKVGYRAPLNFDPDPEPEGPGPSTATITLTAEVIS